jgi:PPK2 family polyphosphate:nucleotide phosphotransferase
VRLRQPAGHPLSQFLAGDRVVAAASVGSTMIQLDHSGLLVEPGRIVDLTDFDPASTGDFKNKHSAREKLRVDIERLSALQDIFFAQGHYALLIILQGMDGAGKDGVIKHVMTGVNPQGIDVNSFKVPSAVDLTHDYLWRSNQKLPPRGKIGIFNRSYYEELAVVRVHPEVLAREQLPPEVMAAGTIWSDRYADITAFERHLSRNGTRVLKFFLHLSNEEQRRRLLERIDTPAKNWKLSAADVRERTFWEAYQNAYEELLTHTSVETAPWYVVPADHKWFTRVAVASIIVAELDSLGLEYPQVNDEQRENLAAIRTQLREHAYASRDSREGHSRDAAFGDS